MEKLIITAAICGAEVSKEQNPNIPYTIEEIGKEAESAYNAGASIIHLHVREDDGTPTQSKKRFKEGIEEIKKRCPDVIIMPSTGGAVGMTNEERLQPIYLQPAPLMASLDCGTMNFGGDEIFVNTETTIKYFAEEMNNLGIKPELECFDKSHIDMALRQYVKGIIKNPMHFNLVFGVNGGITATPRDLVFLVESLPKDSTYTVTGIGRHQFPVATMGIIYGGHIRVGLEDNLFLSKGKLAESNGQLVEKVVRIAQELGREIASPNDVRQILNLKK
ncbi:MAG: 3-keto-5-aminohexanoate cleavage protein [Candidatus Lokiarchaeota archaeon]|nr:3-keto-5-aminohexanoate cleavage protein [Candidatus Lokiarchaeota archaeon]